MVYAFGKIEDLFSGQGITVSVHTDHNMDGVEKTLLAMREHQERGLIFVNLVDFDSAYGHRNNTEGYAQALEEFDQQIPALLGALAKDDVMIITADHGNDPTTPSTDHSREYVPVLIAGDPVRAGINIGLRETFADLAATIAGMLDVEPPPAGSSFASSVLK